MLAPGDIDTGTSKSMRSSVTRAAATAPSGLLAKTRGPASPVTDIEHLRYTRARKTSNLLNAHVSEIKPAAQAHVKVPGSPCVQVPPLKHGFGLHMSVTAARELEQPPGHKSQRGITAAQQRTHKRRMQGAFTPPRNYPTCHTIHSLVAKRTVTSKCRLGHSLAHPSVEARR